MTDNTGTFLFEDTKARSSQIAEISGFLVNHQGQFIATALGALLMISLAYAMISQPTNNNFSNTKTMFAECVPVNGRCP